MNTVRLFLLIPIFIYAVTFPAAYIIIVSLYYNEEKQKLDLKRRNILFKVFICQLIIVGFCLPIFVKLINK